MNGPSRRHHLRLLSAPAATLSVGGEVGRVGAYVADRLGRGEIAPSTAVVIAAVLRKWERQAGDPPWTEEQAAAWVQDPTVRPSTRKSRLTKLRPYVRWLMIQGVLDQDPTLRIGRIRVPKGAP